MTWLLFVRRYWPFVAIAALLALAVVQGERLRTRRAELAACAADRAQLAADVRAKTAEAQAADLAHARSIETARTQATETSSATIEAQLADARARAADLTRRLRERAQADRGGGGAPAVPEAADAPARPARAGEAAVVAAGDDDAVACAEAVTKAQGWQDWWRAVAAIGA